MSKDLGRVGKPTGLSSPTEPASSLGPSGFDPSRREDAAYWRGRYEGFIEALRKTHTPEQLAGMGIV